MPIVLGRRRWLHLLPYSTQWLDDRAFSRGVLRVASRSVLASRSCSPPCVDVSTGAGRVFRDHSALCIEPFSMFSRSLPAKYDFVFVHLPSADGLLPPALCSCCIVLCTAPGFCSLDCHAVAASPPSAMGDSRRSCSQGSAEVAWGSTVYVRCLQPLFRNHRACRGARMPWWHACA